MTNKPYKTTKQMAEEMTNCFSNNMTHTKTPYRADHSNILNDKEWIAECYGDNSEANAKFIIKAVNNHENLISALQLAEKEIYNAINGRNQNLSSTWHDIKQALEKVEE